MITLGRGHRPKVPSTRLKDFVTNTVLLNPTPASTSLYPISDYVTASKLSLSHRAYQTAITTATEPQSFAIAARDHNWLEAMSAEINAHELNNTFSITSLPKGSCKWVYKLKFKSDGSLERYKARLVALGNRQKPGVDYDETFAPVAKMTTVRTFLRYAAGLNWIVHQMDVHNAFLHGDLDEEVYMRLPPGFESRYGDQVCRLHKSIYGLKQSPRCWFSKLSTALTRYGFHQSTADYSLFMINRPKYSLRILVYVDDLIIAGSSEVAVSHFKAYLASHFKMKDLGLLKYFLGLEVARNNIGFVLCQRKYALDIIADTGLLGSRPSLIPIQQHHSLALSKSDLLDDASQYRRLVGKLIYLANTRPDMSYSVHVLAQFMQKPRHDHWTAALRLVRYLKLHPGRGILLRADSDLSITGWCDSDYATCPVTRRSLSGYIVQIGGSTISWKTKKQKTVSTSSAEAEYRSMAMLTKELIWVKRLLADLGVRQLTPMVVHSDSKSAIAMARNPVFHERTKHVGVDCHFIRDEVTAKNIRLTFVTTKTQLADLLTKALGHRELTMHHDKLGIIGIHAPT